MVSVTSSGPDDFDRLRLKWFVNLTGGTNYNQADSQVQSYIRSITNGANNNWNSMDKSPNRTLLWSDLDSVTVSADLTSAYGRINSMALGYATWGGSLYTNEALAADILGRGLQ